MIGRLPTDMPKKWKDSDVQYGHSYKNGLLGTQALWDLIYLIVRIAFIDGKFYRVTDQSGSSMNYSYCYDDGGGE